MSTTSNQASQPEIVEAFVKGLVKPGRVVRVGRPSDPEVGDGAARDASFEEVSSPSDSTSSRSGDGAVRDASFEDTPPLEGWFLPRAGSHGLTRWVVLTCADVDLSVYARSANVLPFILLTRRGSAPRTVRPASSSKRLAEKRQ